jgi:hypothetical protein
MLKRIERHITERTANITKFTSWFKRENTNSRKDEAPEQPKPRQCEGRPKKYENGIKRICISLPVELVETFKSLGGSNWVREEILKKVEQNSSGIITDDNTKT